MIDFKIETTDPTGIHNDIVITENLIELVESTAQHQADILVAAQGQYKQFPDMGVDVANFVNDHDQSHFLRTVKQQFSRDGMKVYSLDYSGGHLIIEAEYEDD